MIFIMMEMNGYKICRGCNQLKNLETEYFISSKSYCKVCMRKISNERAKRGVLENGGSAKVISKPNHYADAVQKKGVFDLMIRLGWTYDEKSGIWFKDEIKTIDGFWPKLKYPVKKEKKIQPKHSRTHSQAWRVLETNKEEIFRKRNEGIYFKDIAEEYYVALATLRKFYYYYNEKVQTD